MENYFFETRESVGEFVIRKFVAAQFQVGSETQDEVQDSRFPDWISENDGIPSLFETCI